MKKSKLLQKTLLFGFFCLTSTFLGCRKNSDCRAQPVKDCLCMHVYEPVCGCDNKTYGNSCEATCAGVSSYSRGACD